MRTEHSNSDHYVGLAVATPSRRMSGGPARALAASWGKPKSIIHAGKEWFISEVDRLTNDAWIVRIGYVPSATDDTDWRDELGRGGRRQTGFPPAEDSSGVVIPVAVRPATGIMAFQLLPGHVDGATFASVMEALLNSDVPYNLWSVRLAVEDCTWEDWNRAVERMTRFDIKVERPNPHYNEQRIEEALEGIRLEYLRLTGSAASEEGIDSNADLFRQAVNHVLQGYGGASINGINREGLETTWLKRSGDEGKVAVQRQVVNTGTVEVTDPVLVDVLNSEAERPIETADLPGLNDGADKAV